MVNRRMAPVNLGLETGILIPGSGVGKKAA